MLSPQARSFAASVRGLVAASPLTGREIARHLGRARPTLLSWCQGASLPRREHLDQLLAVLAVPQPQRATLGELLCAAEGAGPDWSVAASAVLSGARVPAGLAADVLDALARHCAGSPSQCATSVTPEDLRGIAATITR